MPIKQKTYLQAIKYAARIIADKREAERTGRAALFDGVTDIASQTACGKPLGECTKEDLSLLAFASDMVVDYLMISGELAEQQAKPKKGAA